MRNKAIANLLTHRRPAFSFSGTFVRPFLFWSVTHARINSPSMGHMLLCIYWFRTLILKTKCYVLCQFPVASLFSEVSSRQWEYHNFLLTATLSCINKLIFDNMIFLFMTFKLHKLKFFLLLTILKKSYKYNKNFLSFIIKALTWL